MDATHKWLCLNVLTINVKKTCYMTFDHARKPPDSNIRIDGEKIERVTSYKYLGLILDDNLSFKEHIDHVKKMIRPLIKNCLGVLRIFHSVSSIGSSAHSSIIIFTILTIAFSAVITSHVFQSMYGKYSWSLVVEYPEIHATTVSINII